MTATMSGPTPTLTEVDVAADALVALLASRLVPADRAMEACRVVGIALGDLDNARLRFQNGRRRPPRAAEMLPTLTGPDFARRPSERAFRGKNGSQYDTVPPKDVTFPLHPLKRTYHRGRVVPRAEPPNVADQPTTERFCVPCGMWKPPDDFPPAGQRCRTCVNATRRERYLSVERAAAIERATLRYVMAADDPVVACGRCHQPLLAGDDVVAVAVELIHARHLEKDACG